MSKKSTPGQSYGDLNKGVTLKFLIWAFLAQAKTLFFCAKKHQFASLFSTFGKNIGFEGFVSDIHL